MPDSDALAIDVQRALQQAIVDANDAAHLSKKKGKNRARDDHIGDGERAGEVTAKKRKKSKHQGEGVAGESHPVLDVVTVLESGGAVADEATDMPKKKKHKKKDKDKGKQRTEPAQDDMQAEEPVSVPQPAPVDDLGASSEDFLSAVVAAASATSHMHPAGDFPHPIQYSDSMLQYPPGPGEFPPFGGPSQMFHSSVDGVELPDLSLVSSEYLLQTLQNLDISQITSVLKSLGDNGAAFPSLNITPSYVPLPQPAGPPPVKQTSARSVAILGRHPKQVKASGQSTRSLPPPALPPPIVSPDEDNPDHAHMLANVWMNASKLAQMVRTHGEILCLICAAQGR